MVGAEREVYEQVKPIFKQWASLVIHAGEPGAGTRMKLARNMLTFTSYAAAGEAMKLADAAGLDLQALGRVVRHTDALTGGPGAVMIRDNLDDLEPGHWLYDIFVHTRGLGRRIWVWLSGWVIRWASSCLLPNLRCRRWPPALVFHTERVRNGRTAPQGPRQDEGGLRLGHARHAR